MKEDEMLMKEDKRTKSLNLNFIALLSILSLVTFMFLANGCSAPKPPEPTRAPQPPVATTTQAEPSPTPVDNSAEAIKKVKDVKGSMSGFATVQILELYRVKKEKTNKIQIKEKEWKAVELTDKGEPNRFYDVSCLWEENGRTTEFKWTVDLKSGEVIPSNSYAKILKSYDIELAKEATPTPAKTTDGGDITIIPPETPISVKPPTPKKTETNDSDIEATNNEESFYQLAGVMSLGRTRKAMLQKDGRAYDASIGTKLPDGWVVQAITNDSITLKKGGENRKVMMNTNPFKGKETATPDKTAPTTKPVDNKSVQGGPPAIPAPGDDAPANNDKAPKKPGQPTIIPIN